MTCPRQRQNVRERGVPRYDKGKSIELEYVQTLLDRHHLGCVGAVGVHSEDVRHRVRLIEGHDKRTPSGPRVVERCFDGKSRLARTALADEQSDRSVGLGAGLGQPSTRFFSSLSAVSVMTFSALRLNSPIIGMFKSTASS
jgi:hypothetical protein